MSEEINENKKETTGSKFNVDREILKAYGENEKPKNIGAILFPSESKEKLEALLEENGVDLNPVDVKSLSKYQRRLLDYLEEISKTADISYASRTLTRDDSDWGQYVEHEGGKLGPGKPKLPSNADPVMKIRYATGLGGVYGFPLWHSGFWINLSTPSQGRYLNLVSDIFLQKRELGRASNGLIFSNFNAYTINELMEFILQHVESSTYEANDLESLMDAIDVRDIPTLVMGMAYTMFNNGYEFQQPCISSPDCDFVATGEINLGRTFFVDRNAFTDEQKSFMAKRVKRTKEDLERYQGMFVYKCKRTFELENGINVKIGPCSLAKFRDVGYYWVESIVNATQEMFSSTMTIEKRREHVLESAVAAGIRQYSHFFESVTSDGDDGISYSVDTVSDLDGVLAVLSESQENTNRMYEALAEYWKHGIHTFVGIPKYTCPSCGKQPSIPEEQHTHDQLIPIDTIRVFFTLLALQKQRLIIQEMNREY